MKEYASILTEYAKGGQHPQRMEDIFIKMTRSGLDIATWTLLSLFACLLQIWLICRFAGYDFVASWTPALWTVWSGLVGFGSTIIVLAGWSDPHFNTGLKANTLRLRYLLMADDSMRDIRVFQVCDLFLDQFNRQSAHRIFQMCDLRCPEFWTLTGHGTFPR
jgi:hypothetical protein